MADESYEKQEEDFGNEDVPDEPEPEEEEEESDEEMDEKNTTTLSLGVQDFALKFIAEVKGEICDDTDMPEKYKEECYMMYNLKKYAKSSNAYSAFDPNYILNNHYINNNPKNKASREELSKYLVEFLKEYPKKVFMNSVSSEFVRENALVMSKLAIMETFCSRKAYDLDLSMECFKNCLDEILQKSIIGIADPGSMVGLWAASAIIQPLTQSTLNTFHKAGIKNAVVSRLKQFLQLLSLNLTIITKKNKTGQKNAPIQEKKVSVATMYLKFRKDIKIEPKEVIKIFASNFMYNFIVKIDISIKPTKTDELKAVDFYAKYALTKKSLNEMCMRIELNRDNMFERNIGIFDIVGAIIGEISNIIPIIVNDFTILLFKEQYISGADHLSDFMLMKEKIINTRISGIKGITEIQINNDAIITTGSNFLEALKLRFIDPYQSYTTDLNEAYNFFGIEGAKKIFRKEAIKILETDNLAPNTIDILVNSMTTEGFFTTLSQQSMMKRDVPIKNAMHNRPYEVFWDAAINNKDSETSQVSASMLAAKPPLGGIGMCKFIYVPEEK